MSNAVAVSALVIQSFPLGTVAGPVLFELLDSTSTVIASQPVTSGAADASATATFSNVAPGTYTIRATRQDGGGNALAPAVVSAPFTVTVTTTTVTVPSTITVTVQ
jgi:uncharacterized protein (DUF2141 family)